MKKLLFSAMLLALLVGCETIVKTPIPSDAAAVVVGLGYKCDKAELRRNGTELDISSIEERINLAYGHGVKDSEDTSHYIGPYSEVMKHYVLKDNRATVLNVKNAIKEALKKELAIIYFSCKAQQVPTDDPREADGLDEAIVLYDGLLVDNDIWDMLKSAKGRVFLVFDTSHSASMFRATSEEQEVGITDGLVEVENSNMNVVCWAACNEDETVAERSIGSKMTNTFYFKESPWFSYDMIFNKMQKSLNGKQNIKKIVIGEDFSDRTIFR